MKNLLTRQKELGDLAALEEQKILSGKIRKASCLEYMDHIQTVMKEFTANHNNIMVKKSQEAEEYIAKNYFEHVMQTMENSIQNLRIQSTAEGVSAVSSMWQIESTPQTIQVAPPEAASGVERKYQRRAKMLKSTMDEIRRNALDFLEQMREFKTKLQIQFENVEESYFETQNIKLVETTEESIEEQIDVFRQEYKIIIERITEKLNNYNSPQTMYSNIKLQEIKIPMFYGEMKQWSSFHDLFKSLVHDSKHFTEVEKMFRLKTSLGGEAGRLIQHLPVTATNYEAAWQILKERYENRRLQFTAQVDRLLDQPTANGESAQSMKQLLDTTKECIYALKGLNLNLNDEQAIIARIVVRKLDKESLRLYEQNVKKSRDIQSLDDVFSFLEQQYQALDAIRDRKPTKWNNQKQPQRTPTFYTAAQNNCVYCKVPGHQIGECRKFQTLTTMNRRRFITNNKLCYICRDHVYEGKCK
ncbi:uncharacterized protein LOC125779310 [Bactrocera dorsalis]|uniref:Uncharacterized protein LOC125779310 n=1 Tax=Bactrocera dorsalis TaxID=27457 RepID=A0ABM3K4Z2_BACDO|nr:uncharacterized protein LOC125779310 [Bactrocera dorsalis]